LLLLLHPQVALGLWLHKCRQALKRGDLPIHLRADIEAAVGPELVDKLWGASLVPAVERGAGAVCTD
jgi:hypothetical protein